MLNDIKARRLRLGELFKYAGVIFKKNFIALTIISVCVYLPYYIIVSLLPVPPLSLPASAVTSADYNNLFQFMYGVIAVSIIFTPLAIAAATYITQKSIEGEKPGFPGIMDASLIKWVKLIITALIYMLIVGLGAIIIVPGIYFSVLYTFYPNVVAVQDKWGMDALLHSKKIVKGRWWATFGFILMISVLSFLVSFSGGIVFSLLHLDTGFFLNIIESVVFEILLMYFQIMIALWYFNQLGLEKAEKEGD